MAAHPLISNCSNMLVGTRERSWRLKSYLQEMGGGVGRGQTEHNVFDLPSLEVSCILACLVHFRKLSLVTVNPGKTCLLKEQAERT